MYTLCNVVYVMTRHNRSVQIFKVLLNPTPQYSVIKLALKHPFTITIKLLEKVTMYIGQSQLWWSITTVQNGSLHYYN